MSLSHLPNHELIAAEDNAARSALRRQAMVWGPPFLITGAALLYFTYAQVIGDGSGSVVLVIVLSLLTFLFGFQAIQATRDLSGGTEKLTGIVTRRWARNDNIVLKTHYIRIEGKIMRINKAFHDHVQPGKEITAEYYPASMLAVHVEVHEKEEDDEGEPEPASELDTLREELEAGEAARESKRPRRRRPRGRARDLEL